jgi:hypothetical protein
MFRLSPRWSAGCALLPLLMLAACGHAPDDINEQIETGHAAKAIAALDERLASNPDDPVYTALALKAHLYHCAEEDCPATEPAELKTITSLAARVKGPVALDKQRTIAPAEMFRHAAGVMASSAKGPDGLMALYASTPDEMRPVVVDAAFGPALENLRARKPEPAARVMDNISRADKFPEIARDWALASAGLIHGDPSTTESGVIGLRGQQKFGPLPAAALRTLPYTLLAPAGDVPTLAQTLISTTTGWQVPLLLDPPAMAHVADEVNAIRENPAALKRLLRGNGAVTAITSATTVLNTEDARNQLMLMRLSLALNPAQPELWHTFLTLAARAMAQTGDPALLAGPGAPAQPPKDLQETYITTLFRALESQSAKGQALLPLLQQLDLLKLDSATEVRLEKMVQAGLEAAANGRRVDDVVAYALFKPEVARNNRQNVVPLVVEAVREDLRNQRFDHADKLADVVQNQLSIDINYDALILQEFEEEVKASDIMDKLSADTPDALLQPAETATADLGPLWTFMKEHFAKQPAVLDQELKNLIAAARGMYGTPTAMYKLYRQFGDTTFPPDARQAYLLGAIQKSLTEDDHLTGQQLTDYAWRLSHVHEDLSLAPLIENALSRCQTLEDSRNLWGQAPAPVRQTITTVRPQFAALMRGIDAWNAGHRTRAAAEFSELTGAAANQYADQLAPYLETLRDRLIALSGLYVAASPTAALPTGMILVSAPALAASGTLQMLDVTLLGKLGTASELDHATLATSHGVIRKVTFETPVDFDANSLALGTDLKETHSNPEAFEKSFGDITKLAWSTDGSLITAAARGVAPATFTKAVAAPDAPLFPAGRYVVKAQLSPHDPNTDLLLPPGAILDISTDHEATTAVRGSGEAVGVIYTVTGTLRHPAMAKPQPVTGYYEPDKHTLNFTYTSPLSQGDTARAAMRCQVLGHALLCGAHHTHSNREQFTHQVLAVQTREAALAEDKQWATASANTLNAWKHLKPETMLQGSDARDNAGSGDAASIILQGLQPSPTVTFASVLASATTVSGSAVSGTAVSATVSVSATAASPTAPNAPAAPLTTLPAPRPNAEVLPPPSFADDDKDGDKPPAPAAAPAPGK